jgi:hypothetical protein
MTIYGGELGARFTPAEAHAARLRMVRRQFSEVPRDDLERVDDGDLLADRGSGILFEPVRQAVIEAQNRDSVEGVHCFTIDGDEVVFLRRSARAGTITELREQQAKERQEQDQAREREQEQRRAFLAGQPPRVVTAAEIEGRDLPTVRQAALEVLAAGGRLEVGGDRRLRVELPDRVAEIGAVEQDFRRPLLTAAKVLYMASKVVVETIEGRGRKPLDPTRLPDQQVLPSGGVA